MYVIFICQRTSTKLFKKKTKSLGESDCFGRGSQDTNPAPLEVGKARELPEMAQVLSSPRGKRGPNRIQTSPGARCTADSDRSLFRPQRGRSLGAGRELRPRMSADLLQGPEGASGTAGTGAGKPSLSTWRHWGRNRRETSLVQGRGG